MNFYCCNNLFRSFLFKLENRSFKFNHTIVIKKTKTFIKGSDNNVIIGSHSRLTNCEFRISGSNNKIVIEDCARINGVVFWIEDDNNVIRIGKNSTFEGNTQIAACEGKKVEIGEDCMFSHSILIRTTDSHSIVDKEGVRINQASDIYIGNHVWIGLQSLILKGAEIPDNCVVGARSIVASYKEFEPNSVIVGSPAKCVRKNINWLRDRI